MAQQRLQGAFLTVIGLAGMVGGVMFSIEAPRFTPVPVVFLTFWLIMVIVGRIFFTGLSKLRSAGVGAPAPEQVRAAAAVAGIVVAVGMMGFAATGPGAGVASAAPCPGGGPATCGPGPGPDLTITPPAQQTTAPGGQQGNQGSGQDNNGIATSPAGSGGNNGDGIQAQTPQFGTPGQQAPNIPGNPTGQGQQPGQGQGQGNQQQSPVRTTAPGQPTQSGQRGQQTSGQPTVTVTQTQSQCPAPGAAGSGGAPGIGGSGADGGSGGAGPDSGGDDQGGAPSWSYLVAEAAGVMAGRRRSGGAATKPTADQAWQIWDQAKEGNRSPAEVAGLKLNPDGTSADPSFDIITVPKEDGGYQKLILMKNQNAPKQYRFPLNTPEGGRSEKNSDGSISVFDRNGEKVGQFNAPWAYDANGKEVPTWYDIDGDDMVQRIEPGPDNVYPIIADPLWDKIKSAGNSVKNFGAGVGRSVADTAEGIGQMVTNPKETAKGMAPLVGLGGDGAPGVGESWGAVGKAFIAKDDFDRGDTAYASGKVVGNVLQTLVDPTKGGGKAASIAGKTAKAAKAAEEVAETSASTAAKTAGRAAEAGAEGAGDAARTTGRTATNAAGDAASAGTQAASEAAQTAGRTATNAAGDAASAGTQAASEAAQTAGRTATNAAGDAATTATKTVAPTADSAADAARTAAVQSGRNVAELTSGGKGNWTKELHKPKPDTTYIVDGGKFIYNTDSKGRVTETRGILSDLNKSDRNGYQQGVSGRGDRLPGDQGGHLWGTQFGGPGEGINITAMKEGLNQAGKNSFYEIERQWAKQVAAGSPVDATIRLAYSGDSVRPSSYVVSWINESGNTVTRRLFN
ncbi:DNA/RNA non-specific endonuclease [Tsukamurella strandjordii]|uniref:DNA/RNA non-specific endonuclease n=1 Tax=Tsukamurella strandjordii TaxID=147577 RepID=A0AA90NE09_9ACTN|nr:DNA/RNA non-specific endonuclease [Tsukamurella strandjordii]MDP0396731.1 DNA/RNA non-specific endonuclease [Tsukamurella strandjordii]